jgi:D-alanyl-D-alanine carboxypeptidase
VRATVAVLAATVLVLTACRADVEPDPGTAPATSSTGELALDPAMAVDPPGRLTARLFGADILVVSEERISRQTRERISELAAVAAVESLSLSQVTIENSAINVAAVDPATYRRFTPRETAEKQRAWERVAGGELAIGPDLGRTLVDDRGYLTMGGSADAPEVHVGAFAQQIPQVDVVVNERWGEALGMPAGNALLISTDEVAPDVVRPRLVEIVGDQASVQRLDVAARLGLDTTGIQTAVLTGGSVADTVGAFNYTVVGGGRIAPEQSWVDGHISTETMPILGPMTCNSEMFPQLRAALLEIVREGLAGEIHPDEYAGCYSPRFIAGTTTLSNHSFGLAFDLNVPGNQRGTVGEIDRRVVAVFERWGFTWGGDWSWTDPMHFEMNQLVAPR